MNLKKLVLFTATILTLAGFQSAARAGLLSGLIKSFGPAPIELDNAPTPDKSVSVDSFKQLKDCKKVVVTAFNVQFITKKDGGTHAGTGGEGAAHVNSHIKLLGLTNETFQAITDQAYTNFTKGLQSLGLEVMPYSEYAALPEYADMKSHFTASPMAVSGGMFSGEPSELFSPTGMPIVLFGDELALSKGNGMTAYIGMSAPFTKEAVIAKATGVAAVHLYLVVDFCQMEANGGTFSFSAKMTTKPQISISKVSRCSFFFNDSMYNGGREFVKMKNNAFGADEYVSEFNNVTTTGQKAGDVAVNVLNVLNGSGDTYKNTYYEATASPALYQAACVKYLTAVQDLMFGGIKEKTTK
jgi:hypothetical protein